MLYQAYGCKERTKHRVANQMTRRQVKNLTKKQNVLIIVLVIMRMWVKLRSKMFGSCIGRNGLILGILTFAE